MPVNGLIYELGKALGISDPAAPYEELTFALPRYSPIKNFPMVNRSAVTTAPIQTSRHAMPASGSSLNIMANSVVMTPNDNAKFSICNTDSGAGNIPSNTFPAAANAVLSSNDTIRRNPMPRIITTDKNRSGPGELSGLLSEDAR